MTKLTFGSGFYLWFLHTEISQKSLNIIITLLCIIDGEKHKCRQSCPKKVPSGLTGDYLTVFDKVEGLGNASFIPNHDTN